MAAEMTPPTDYMVNYQTRTSELRMDLFISRRDVLLYRTVGPATMLHRVPWTLALRAPQPISTRATQVQVVRAHPGHCADRR